MLNKEQIIEQIIKNNNRVLVDISKESTDEDILEFLYNVISKDNEYSRYSNVISFYEYILYLNKDELKNELLDKYMTKVLSIKGIAKEFIYMDETELKCIFNNDEYVRSLCKGLIEYYDEEIYSFSASFYSYELCITYLCKYYSVFKKLFEFEGKFLHLLRYAISYSGENGDTGYAYKGLEEVKNNIYILGRKLIIKLLDCFDSYSIKDSMRVKQLLTIITASQLNKEKQEMLKFFYIDAKIIEESISETIENKIIFSYNNYVSSGEIDTIFEEESVVKTIINRVSKYNSERSIKFLVKCNRFSKKDFIIEIDGQQEFNLISVIYNQKKNLIQLIDEAEEILNLPYEFRTIYTKIKYKSEEHAVIENAINKKFEQINDSEDKNLNIYEAKNNGNNNEVSNKEMVKYDTTDLNKLIDQLKFATITEKALIDAKVLIETTGAINAVDRIHTALHAYLITICSKYKLPCPPGTSKDPDIRVFFKTISEHLFKIKNNGSIEPVKSIFDQIMKMMHQLNEIRNRNTLAHPNKKLLYEAEARLIIDCVLMILKYLNFKLDELGEDYKKDNE